MIRIVKEENTQALNQQSKAALSLIGVAVAKNPNKIFQGKINVFCSVTMKDNSMLSRPS